MRMVYLDVVNGEVKTVDVDPKLSTYYKLLDCDCIEMPERRIGVRSKKYFTIICNESGLLKDRPIPSAIDNLGNIMLVGNLLFCKVNYDTGREVGLTQDEAEYIKRFILPMSTKNTITGEIRTYFMLTQCEY